MADADRAGTNAGGQVLLALLTLLGAYALKRFYSAATAEDLWWILRPTAFLVTSATGELFAYEAGFGFYSRNYQIVIAPACAGVNFLVIAACSIIWGLAGECRSWRGALRIVAGGYCTAYAWTLVANTTRILAALELGISSPEAHRLEGIVVYLVFLFILNGGVKRPLAIYWAVTLAVPFLNGAAAHSRFWEHAAWTLAAGTVVAVVGVVFGLFRERRRRRRRGDILVRNVAY